MKKNPAELNTVLVTDCGSTTTKALLFERTPQGWRQTFRGEAPTTVEEPVADVTVGALNAFTEVQELSGRQVLSEKKESAARHPFALTTTQSGSKSGIDLYLSTSSAGGGLQMLVTGVAKRISAESAERAALGAGAIVMDSLCADDGRLDHERIERVRHLKPDIVLMAGGIEAGTTQHAVETAELLVAASPRARFGDTLKLPVVYAGNTAAAADVEKILENRAQVRSVANVRPDLDRENLDAARDVIHEFFLSHVMSHAPGYGKLLQWTPVPVMPTPAAVGDMVLAHAERTGSTVLCADIGGATTDMFSVFPDQSGERKFNRTVSANYGMSYSVAHVLIEAGAERIARWLPYEISLTEVSDRLRNKMIRPTSIPQTKEDLWLEQAVCREALRLSLGHHRSFAVGLSGQNQKRSIADIFAQKSSRYELVDLKRLDLVIGSGGVLSHAPERLGAALMMLDGFELEAISEIAVDSIFMMPHLGVFASVYPEAAQEIFMHDCLVPICHSVVAVYPRALAKLQVLAEVRFAGKKIGQIEAGKVLLIDGAAGTGMLEVVPLHRQVDVGAGRGNTHQKEITLHPGGILADGRNRPIELPADSAKRVRVQKETFERLKLL